MSGPIATMLSVVTGSLLGASLPPYDNEWLGWIAVAPLLVAAARRRPLESAGLGLVAGLACGIVQGSVSLPFALLGLLLGAVAALASMTRPRLTGPAWVAVVACAGVAAEWMTTFLPIPVHMALSQYLNQPILQVASVSGIWGVSLLLWIANAAVAEACLVRRLSSLSLAVALTLTAMAFGWGFWSLRDSQPPLRRQALRVAAVQVEGSHFGQQSTNESQGPGRVELTRRAAAEGAKLIVWPELCLGNAFDPARPGDPTLTLARSLGVHLVAGHDERDDRSRYNSAALIGPDGRVLGVHHKVHLWLDESGKAPGTGGSAFRTELGDIGVEICFDSCFTDVTREAVRSGAQIVAMPNLDPPTPGGLLHRLHGAVLPFRAVENRVPIVRADQSGLSQIIDSRGRIVAQAPMNEVACLLADVSLGDGRGTVFTRLGDWLAYGCVGATLMFVTLAVRRVRPRGNTHIALGESTAGADAAAPTSRPSQQPEPRQT